MTEENLFKVLIATMIHEGVTSNNPHIEILGTNLLIELLSQMQLSFEAEGSIHVKCVGKIDNSFKTLWNNLFLSQTSIKEGSTLESFLKDIGLI